MDVRDLQYWYVESKKKMIQDQIKRITAARLAMAASADYNKAISELERQFRVLSFGEDKLIQDNWEDLKRRKRG